MPIDPDKTAPVNTIVMQKILTGKTRLPGFSGKWEKKRFGDICTFLSTASNPRADLEVRGDVGYIHYGNVHAHPRPALDCSYHELPRIDDHRIGNASRLQDGDLVMVDASENLTGLGKSVEILGIGIDKIVAGLHTILCRGRSDHWAPGFKSYLQYIPAFRSALTRMATGISVYAISRKQLADIVLALPSPSEQVAIVAVLSDVDRLIESLEGLVAKKRAVKTSIMQQLLTGRTRLPGFRETQWKTKKIGDLLTYERPDRYVVQHEDYAEWGDVPVLTANKSFVLGYTNETFGVCIDFPVILFDDFTTDCKYVTFPFKVKSSAIKLLRAKKDVNLRYMCERMRMMYFPVVDHRRYYISDYQNVEIALPAHDEQVSIAVILSDMDAEIFALERRLAKVRALKQGAMQQLLTGRIRLPATDGIAKDQAETVEEKPVGASPRSGIET